MTQTRINDDMAGHGGRGYAARGIVMRLDKMGNFSKGGLTFPIYRYISLDCGPDQPKKLVEFSRVGDIKEDEGGAYLDFDTLKEGDVVINPCFIYRERQWNAIFMAKHLEALQKYKPKVIVTSDIDKTTPAFDMGAISLTQ
jgi:hypothetical protein